mmetsp:Transcript_26527/g.85828  ORF Transcript_26527/g.85828 Transcript_26527/m.85828 type:complete len:264 (+) Transcript_26527:3079-3870(+)
MWCTSTAAGTLRRRRRRRTARTASASAAPSSCTASSPPTPSRSDWPASWRRSGDWPMRRCRRRRWRAPRSSRSARTTSSAASSASPAAPRRRAAPRPPPPTAEAVRRRAPSEAPVARPSGMAKVRRRTADRRRAPGEAPLTRRATATASKVRRPRLATAPWGRHLPPRSRRALREHLYQGQRPSAKFSLDPCLSTGRPWSVAGPLSPARRRGVSPESPARTQRTLETPRSPARRLKGTEESPASARPMGQPNEDLHVVAHTAT